MSTLFHTVDRLKEQYFFYYSAFFIIYSVYITSENSGLTLMLKKLEVIIHDSCICHPIAATVNGVWCSHCDFRLPLQKTYRPHIRWFFAGVWQCSYKNYRLWRKKFHSALNLGLNQRSLIFFF